MDDLVKDQIQKAHLSLALEGYEFRVRGRNLRGVGERCITSFFLECFHFIFVFVFLFFSLMLVSNWRAFSLIADQSLGIQASVIAESESDFYTPSLSGFGLNGGQAFVGELSDRDDFYPPDYRIEIPKVFEGTVPVRSVDGSVVDFARFYDQAENEMQSRLKEGVVRYPFTADPGEYGNVFITGHSSNYRWAEGDYKEIFALLHLLKTGDEYFIYYQGRRYTYRVFSHFEVKPDDVAVLRQPLDRKIATLMTCTPIGTTLRRLIVQAELVKVDE